MSQFTQIQSNQMTSPPDRNKQIRSWSEEDSWSFVERAVPPYARAINSYRSQLLRQWFINCAYFVGWQTAKHAIVGQDFDPNLLQPTDDYQANHIFRIVMGNIARLSQARPSMDVVANTPDQRDQRGAKVAEHMADWVYERYQLRRMRQELALWVQLCGNHWWLSDWNKTAGQSYDIFRSPFDDTVLNASAMNPMRADFLRKAGKVEQLNEGDLEIEQILAFQVHTSPKLSRLEDMTWIGLESVKPVDWVWDRYGKKKAEKIQNDDLIFESQNGPGMWWQKAASLISQHSGLFHGSWSNDPTEAVRIRHVWIRPSARIPKGGYIVATNKMLLEFGENPYVEDGLWKPDGLTKPWHPLTHFRFAPSPGRFEGLSLVEHLIGPMNDYNRSRTQLIQHRDIVSVPQWLASEDSELTNTRNEIGDIWTYNKRGGKPELQAPPPISQAHVETQDRALYDLQTISAQSEATQAQAPGGVRSGIAIARLQEKDQMVIGPTVEEMETGFTRFFRHTLSVIGHYMAVPRAIELYGRYRMADVGYFSGRDMAGNYNLRITPGSMLPRSRAEQVEYMNMAVQNGALTPQMNPKDRRIFLEAVELGGAEKMLFNREDLNRRRAQIENEMFLDPKQGQLFPDVAEVDDPIIHLEEHELFELTDAYEQLPVIRKMAFQAHKQKHKMQLMEMMEAQMQMQAMAAGPDGAGKSPDAKEPGKASQPRDTQPTPGSDQSMTAA